jgi:hypothetical protein
MHSKAARGNSQKEQRHAAPMCELLLLLLLLLPPLLLRCKQTEVCGCKNVRACFSPLNIAYAKRKAATPPRASMQPYM